MLRLDLADLDENGEIGDWCFLNNNELIAIRFGKEAFSGTSILPVSKNAMPGKEHWEWNNNLEKPTLSPSILIHFGLNEMWHGFLIDGVLKEC